MKKIIGVVIGLVILGALGNGIAQKSQQQPKQNNQPKQQTTSPQKKDFDVSYGKHTRNTMYVVLPDKVSEKTPLVLVIHGGAWISGDKKDMKPIQTMLAKEGIASASMNYRYASNTVHYQELMADVGSAVNYLNNNADDWGMTTDHLVIAGISAGAHMSMLYSYAYDPDNRVKAVISMAGPTDFTDTTWLDQIAKVQQLLGGLDNMTGQKYSVGKPVPAVMEKVSPIKNIKNVPTLLIHGTADSIVFYSQATAMNQALARAGVPHKLVTVDGANHDMGLGNPVQALRLAKEVVSWIEKYAQ